MPKSITFTKSRTARSRSVVFVSCDSHLRTLNAASAPMRYTTHRTPLTCSMTARSLVISATASLMGALVGLVGLRYVDIETLRADDSAGVVSQSVR